MAEDPETSKPKIPANANTTIKDFLPGFPTLTDFSNEGLKRVAEATRAFQTLPPAGPLWDLQKSYPEFRRAMKNCRTRIEPLIKIILEHEMVSTHSYGRRTVDEKLDFLVEANDDILERVGTSLDDAEGLFKRAEMVVVDKSVSASVLKPPGTWGKKKFGSSASGGDFRDASAEVSKKQPIISASTIESRPTKKAVHRLRVTEKPQLKFADAIDNSLNPFVPKLNMKPNSMKPLSILPEYTANNEEFYGHPYEVELGRFEGKDWMLEKCSPIAPKALEETALIYIDTVDGLEEMITELHQVKEIGVDLEHHSYRTFLGLTCLIQISTRDKDFIIDPLPLWKDLEALNEIFTNPKIVKVFHGATCDLEWLQRDFGVYVVGLFDTYLAMKQLNFAHFSLQHLLAHFCSIELDKKYQVADWRLRPLPEEMLTYARQDTHFLLFIHDLLKAQLIEQGNANKNLLRAVYEQSRLACLKRYEKPGRNSQLALRKTRRHLNNRQLFAFTELYNWRDSIGREKDESLSYVLPNHMLLTIAETLPKEMTGILSCCEPIPPLVQQYLGDLHRIILKARDLPLHEDKVEWTGPDKRKKQKEWMILLNSIHDVDESLISTVGVAQDQFRQSVFSENRKPTIDCSDIVIRSSSSIPFGVRRFGTTKVREDSSAYGRYELSNNILDILKNPTKKANLDMDDPVVRAVRDTILGDPAEADKPLSAAVPAEKMGRLDRVLPEKDFVAINPMAYAKKLAKKSGPKAPKVNQEKSAEAKVSKEKSAEMKVGKEKSADLKVRKEKSAETKVRKEKSVDLEVSKENSEDEEEQTRRSPKKSESKRQKRKAFFDKVKWMKKGKKRSAEGDDSPVQTHKKQKMLDAGQKDKNVAGGGANNRPRASNFFVNPFRAKEGKSITFKK